MITDDGTLEYRVRPDPGRLFAHRLRHVVNPVIGVVCGLVLGAALFLVAVQALFGVRPSLVAVVLALAALVVYGVSVLRARRASTGAGESSIVLNPSGVRVTSARTAAAYPWQLFARWLEDEQDFVLASRGWRDRVIVVLPKTGIPDDEQELLREVLHSQIDPDDEPISDAFVEMDWDDEPAKLPRRRATD